MKQHQNKQRGLNGEQLVVDRLVKEGCEILARNYTKQYGEVDIIAKNNEAICFIEVKTRYNPLFDPTELISLSKQKRIIAVAKDFLATHTIPDDMVCRFDVAFVIETKNGTSVSYIANAFTE